MVDVKKFIQSTLNDKSVSITCIYFNPRRIRLIHLEKKPHRECVILRKDTFSVAPETVISSPATLCFWDSIIVWKINRISAEP